MPVAPLYVHRKLLNGDEVALHFAAQGLASTVAPDEMHVTIVYSRQAMDWSAMLPAADILVVPPMRGARGIGQYAVDRRVERLGEHGVLVLLLGLESSNQGVRQLVERWQEYRAAGASYDYDDYLPHITISYAGQDVDIATLQPFPGELRFGPEIQKPIKEDWKPDMSKEVHAAKAMPGDRDNPIEIVAPGDLDRACARVWQPSGPQAGAGNYKKAHAIIGCWDVKRGVTPGGGIHITIETPLDRFRSGVGKDGKPWSVRMPAHYGYVKRTVGADGDQVDVYVGPEAHRAAALPVWVVDQVDADSREFDEHKAFLGFPDIGVVGRTWSAGFSDGRGRERAGAVVRMSFDAFRRWLASPTTKPMAYARSVTFAASPCACGCGNHAGHCNHGHSHGGSMTATVDTSAAPVVKSAGLIQKLLSTAWPNFTPAERTEIVTQAALESTDALGKAVNLLGEGDDHTHEEHVKDLFDGPHDQRAATVHAHGPDSSAAPGKVPVGPNQSASGDGAEAMEREYSRHAPQHGVQRATEMLGEAIAGVRGVRKAMRQFAEFGKSMTMRIGLLESTVGAGAPAITIGKAEIDAAVAVGLAKALPIALAKALPPMLKAMVKAKGESETDKEEEKGEDDEEEEDDDEASEAESGSGTEIEIVNENEADDEAEAEGDEGKKAAHKAAANERLIAKNLLKLAKRAARECGEAFTDGRVTTGVRLFKSANSRLTKASNHLAVAKALREGRVGPSGKAITEQIVALHKAMKKTRAENQEKWPNTSSKAAPGQNTDTTKGGAPDAAALEAAKAEITRMGDTVKKALEGYALMQGDLQSLMTAISGQSRTPTADGSPPTITLVKGGPGDRRARLTEAYAGGTISAQERDKGSDALGLIEQGTIPAGMVEAYISACSPAVQAILRIAA